MFVTVAIFMLMMGSPDQTALLEKLDKYGVVTDATDVGEMMIITKGGVAEHRLTVSYMAGKAEVTRKILISKEFANKWDSRAIKFNQIKVRFLPTNPEISRIVGDLPPPPVKSIIPTIGLFSLIGLLGFAAWKFRHLSRLVGVNLGSSQDNADDDEGDNEFDGAPMNTSSAACAQSSKAASSNAITIKPEHIFPRIKATGLTGELGPLSATMSIGSSGQKIDGTNSPVIQHVSGGLGVMYAFDRGSHWEYLAHGQFEKMGFSHQQLHQRALTNLEAWVNSSGNLQVLTLEHGAYGIAAGGDFEAAFLLLDSLWEGPLKDHTPNGVVCVIPAPDICMFCDARNVNAIRTLKTAVQRINSSGAELLSSHLYRRVNGKWQSFPVDLKPAVETIEFS